MSATRKSTFALATLVLVSAAQIADARHPHQNQNNGNHNHHHNHQNPWVNRPWTNPSTNSQQLNPPVWVQGNTFPPRRLQPVYTGPSFGAHGPATTVVIDPAALLSQLHTVARQASRATNSAQRIYFTNQGGVPAVVHQTSSPYGQASSYHPLP